MADISDNPKKKRQLRKRRCSSESEEDSDKDTTDGVSSILECTKEIQKMRKRQTGVTAQGLAEGKHYTKEKEAKKDTFKLATGGFVDMKALKTGQLSLEESEQIGTSFAAETNRRDEDADMLKYVEIELAKRKGIAEEDKEKEKTKSAEDELYELPDHIKAIISQRKKNEDMLSNQMLSGIPEVELGIDEKIRNIEVTEDAKRKLLQERMNKKDSGISDFVPTNMAVNFVQHNRFTIEDTGPTHKKQEPAPKPVPARVGDVQRPPTVKIPSSKPTNSRGEKATDDFHYEKFKKQLRRY